MAKREDDPQAQAMRDMWAVRRYLEQLDRPPRRVDREGLEAEIDRVRAELTGDQDSLARVQLVQRRIDLEAALAACDQEPEDHTAGFVDAAARYSERKGITWPAWRQVGVPAAVLRQAGVQRTR
jgi:hypothetical protein